MKKYDRVEDFTKDLTKQLVENVIPTYEKVLATSIVDDAITDRYVPIWTGALSESAYRASIINKLEILVIWDTPYAEDVYEYNVSGVPEWPIVTWEKHESEYTGKLWLIMNDKELKM